MTRGRPLQSLAGTLALLATLFGGVFYGLGNMVMLATDPGFAAVLHGDGHGGAAAHDHDGHPSAAQTPRAIHPDGAPWRPDERVGLAPDVLVCADAGATTRRATAHPEALPAAPPQAPPAPSGDATTLGIPAHCMFCLDGVAPCAPPSLAALPATHARPAPISAPRPVRIATARPHSPTQPRAPPLRIA